jgi:5-methylcytosine-specific restriction enzyme A
MGLLSRPTPRVGKIKPLLERLPEPRPVEQKRNAAAPWRLWYKTKRWRELRLRVFVRDLFRCQCGCGESESDTSQLVADHKIPHRGDQRLFWDENNVETWRKSCHDSKKQRAEQGSLHTRGIWD